MRISSNIKKSSTNGILFILCVLTTIGMRSQVGIATVDPQEALHVAGTFRLENGTEGDQKVLMSDGKGTATWEDVAVDNAIATLGTGVVFPANQYDFLQTGTSITLPPGLWAVTVNMLLTRTTGAATPRRTSAWVRSSFSDSPITPAPITADIIGSDFASGNFEGASKHGSLNGLLIINNTSGADKTYYYIAGRVTDYGGPTYSLLFGGIGGTENNIIAYRIE